jgi:hypothetical protein
MKNVNTKRKTASDTRIFKDWLSTVGKYRNPDILESRCTCTWQDLFFSTHEFQAGLRTRFIVQNVSKLPSVDILVMTNIDIYAIAVLEMRASKILESLAQMA